MLKAVIDIGDDVQATADQKLERYRMAIADLEQVLGRPPPKYAQQL